MRTRGCLTVLTGILLAIALAVPAGAATKTVFAGLPPKAQTPAGLTVPKALNFNGFFGRTITINVGDSVNWIFSQRVIHTVTFPAKGQKAPPFVQPDPAHPYTGFSDPAGNPFWFNGQPSVTVPAEVALPTTEKSTDGTGYRNSGITPEGGKPFSYKLRFTKAGTFNYLCEVHPGMRGTVKVLPKGAKGARVLSAVQERAAAVRQLMLARRSAMRLNRFSPSANTVVAGHDRGSVSWFKFFPSVRTVKAGDTVRFTVSSKSEIHTATFGPTAYRDANEAAVIATPQPSGPPLLQLNPLIFLPSDPPPSLPPYDGTNHGNGYLNTGAIDTDPKTPDPSSVSVRFTKPGTYTYECLIHPGMQAKIRVT
jgi:plastocyanin